jgi:hypothetical protein
VQLVFVVAVHIAQAGWQGRHNVPERKVLVGQAPRQRRVASATRVNAQATQDGPESVSGARQLVQEAAVVQAAHEAGQSVQLNCPSATARG